MSPMTLANPQQKQPAGNPKGKPNAGGDGNAVQQLVTYLKGVKSEWGKVSWPTMPQIIAQTMVVLVLVTIMTLGLWAIDSIWGAVMGLLDSLRP